MRYYHCFWKDYYIEIENDLILKTLSDRERLVIRCRFGIGTAYMTLREIGKLFGFNGEQIRQCEAKALRKLRHPSRSKKYLYIEGIREEE